MTAHALAERKRAPLKERSSPAGAPFQPGSRLQRPRAIHTQLRKYINTNREQSKGAGEGKEATRRRGQASDRQNGNWHERGNSRGQPRGSKTNETRRETNGKDGALRGGSGGLLPKQACLATCHRRKHSFGVEQPLHSPCEE